MKTVLALLIVGDLGPVGLRSLSSLDSLDPRRICIASDTLGKSWIQANIPKALSDSLCFHENSQISSVLQRVQTDTYYASFGTNKFIEIMVIKWLLILDIVKNHPGDQCIAYSDLDVMWKSSPDEEVRIFLNSPKLLATQEDYNHRTGHIFLCPGIMFWRNSPEALELLTNLVKIHAQFSLGGNPMPDDKVLNGLINSEGLSPKVYLLPRAKYVIGHRIFDLVAQLRGFRLESTVCYHANYATTERVKLARMSASSLVGRQLIQRVRFLGLLFLLRIVN
jgi:hypothetical protein